MIRKVVLYFFPFYFWPFLTELPAWVLAVSFVLWIFALIQSHRTLIQIRKWQVNLATVIFSFLVYKEFKSILGPEAGSSLILILLGLKLHEIRKPGDVMTVLFTYMILTMNILLFSQSLFMTLYVLLLIGVLVYAFMLLNAPEKSLKQIWKTSPRFFSTDALFALPLFLSMFFLFPRFNVSFGNLLAPPKPSVGFSGNLNPGEMANLATSEAVAFRAVFNGKKVNPKEMYWRGQVLTVTDGFGWKKPDLRDPLYPIEDFATDAVSYNIVLEPKYEKTLFVLEHPLDVSWTDSSRNRIYTYNEKYYETQFPLIHRSYYQGVSSVSKLGKKSSEDVSDNLQLPTSLSKQFHLVVDKIKSKTPEETVRNGLNYFRVNRFSYSLSTPKMRSIDEFLFSYKEGFCEHFASAFAVMMRAAGIPTRVVIGFQGGEYNQYGDYIIVKEKFAHAWTEVFYQDVGWVRIDPTAVINQVRIFTGQVDAPGTEYSRSEINRLWIKMSLLADSINNGYMLFMMRYNYNKQVEILSRLGMSDVKRWKMYSVLFGIGALLFLTYLYLQARPSVKNDRLTESYQFLLAELEKHGFKKMPHEGSFSFSKKIPDLPGQNLLILYTKIKYGPLINKRIRKKFIRAARKYKFVPDRTA